MKRHWMLFVLAGAVLAVGPPAAAADPPPVLWARQLGTLQNDYSQAVTVGGLGNIYISGFTYGALGGDHVGDWDAYLAKYDSGGNHQWTRQLGTTTQDYSYGVAADSSGNSYMAGWTRGTLDGTSAGMADAFVSKYNGAGTKQWTRQFGTITDDLGYGAATDSSGNIYVTGDTFGDLDGTNAGNRDVFLRKYDSGGNHQWTRQFGGVDEDEALAVATDGSGNVYIAADTGEAGSPQHDALLIKYNSSGVFQWSRQFGTAADERADGVATDSLGNIYIAGRTEGDLEGTSAGGADAFVRKYNGAGTAVWTRQFGTTSYDGAQAVAIDSLGNVLLAGSTNGALGGPFEGVTDAFLCEYDSAGNLLWDFHIGTSVYDGGQGVAADSLGGIYLTGITEGDIGGENAGTIDAYLIKLPEPATLSLLAIGAAALLRRRRRSHYRKL